MQVPDSAPQTYQEWLNWFELLSKKNVSAYQLEQLSRGTCPGYRTIEPQFNDSLQKTVNRMLSRSARQCTSSLNEALEEGDFSNIEVLLCRAKKNIEQCRFFLKIPFLTGEFVEELDRQLVLEIRRYWKELENYLDSLEEETESTELMDLLFYIRRMNR